MVNESRTYRNANKNILESEDVEIYNLHVEAYTLANQNSVHIQNK